MQDRVSLPEVKDAQAPQMPTRNQAVEVATPIADKRHEYPDIPIVGRFDKYRSSYWSGVLAAIGMRYAPRPFLRKYFEDSVVNGKPVSHLQKHGYSGFAGAVLSSVAGLYAVKTFDDVKSIMAETVAWETGKEVKDVGFMDLWNSKNSVVQQTMHNFVKFNARRFGLNAVYFSPFIPGLKSLFKKYKFTGEAGMDFGVAANAAYLTNDVLRRKMTPFEELQSLIDRKINHAEHFADTFVATDLLDIYERHAANDKNKSFMNKRGTPEWEEAVATFQRMADLMNQSYYNEVPHEHARFGFSKFITLLGTHKIDPDHMDRTRAYIEIANWYDPKEIEIAAAQFEKGATVEQVMQRYPKAKEALDTQQANASQLRVEMKQTERVPSQAAAYKNILDKKQNVSGFAAREDAKMTELAHSPHVAM